MKTNISHYGFMPDGKEVKLYSITNDNNVTLQLINLGATLQGLYAPDKYGRVADITVGFDSLYGHLSFTDYQGKVVGRYANRIANGRFSLNGKDYQLTQNEKEKTCLHSAGEFSDAVWNAIIVDTNAVEFSYTSPEGTSGFEGNITAKVTYSLTDDNRVVIDYSAVCDKDTVMNFTNHVYFNLNGSAMSDILDHEMQMNASHYTPIDADSIPTGEIRAVEGTAFDFNTPCAIGKRIDDNDEQLILAKGYDHNFCLIHKDGEADVTVKEKISGRKLEMFTDLPGVQLYTGNFLDGTVIGKGGMPIVKRAGFCLETQFYPDSPNQPGFPSCVFKAGEKFESTTMFRISVEE
ncbi:MAG: galactose mutarotase [Clostridia bacterium]|nr:galactose mutarotase [Clostridia bacterium]